MDHKPLHYTLLNL